MVSAGCKPAAVLVPIYGDIPHVIMTEKPKNMRIHAGEISFPGGKPEKHDLDLCETAIRETREELGFEVSRSNILGQLKDVQTLNSRYSIMPFVAVLERKPQMRPNVEVESILDIPLEPLMDTLAPDRMNPGMFTLRYRDKVVWGASARILHHLYLELERT